MRITDLLSKESIRLDGVSSTKKETIRAMADLMENKGVSAYVAVLAALLIGLAFGIVQGLYRRFDKKRGRKYDGSRRGYRNSSL